MKSNFFFDIFIYVLTDAAPMAENLTKPSQLGNNGSPMEILTQAVVKIH